MKIIHTDNLGGDYPDEKFVTGLPRLPEAELQAICNIINDATNSEAVTAPRYYKVVADDYELQPGFEP